MAGMSKKHFEAFARECRALMETGKGLSGQDERADYVRFAAETFAAVARQDNPRFDLARFLRACGLE